MVSTAAAKALGMDVYDVGTRLSGIGEQQGGFAVARELCMGNMKMYNVPFFVVDISSGVVSIDAYMSHLDMIVGVDFMNALGELHVDFENKGLFVPKAQNRLSLEGAPNLCGGVAGLFCRGDSQWGTGDCQLGYRRREQCADLFLFRVA